VKKGWGEWEIAREEVEEVEKVEEVEEV